MFLIFMIIGEQPEDEQISVVIRVPTAAETSTITTLGDASARDIIAGVARFVEKVDNLEVNGKKITNGRELSSVEGMYLLCLNIGTHILSSLTEIDKDPT